MNSTTLSLVVFFAAYLVNIFYITVLYHRGLTHGAVELSSWMKKWTVWTGPWVTGLDPKAWSCMHRLHHLHSDTKQDPHSPSYQGTFGLLMGQLRSYNRMIVGLDRKRESYTSIVRDLDFNVSWMNRKQLWFLPYLLHAVVGVALAFIFHSPLLGFAYFLGMMSHPIQGWMVNSLAHQYGYRNFETSDRSVNNTLVAWLVMGEGYQNNHHASPRSPKFSAKWFEVDMGYGLCRISHFFGMTRAVAILPEVSHSVSENVDEIFFPQDKMKLYEKND